MPSRGELVSTGIGLITDTAVGMRPLPDCGCLIAMGLTGKLVITLLSEERGELKPVGEEKWFGIF